jgi:hypothetical protein
MYYFKHSAFQIHNFLKEKIIAMYVLISHSKINQYWHNNIRQNKPSYKVTNLPNLKGRRNIYFN